MTEANVEKKPNLLDCAASELAAYLLQHRFKGDGMATASFLLECTSTLPNADAISAQLLVGDDDDDDDDDNNGDKHENEDEETIEKQDETPEIQSLGNALAETCTVSMTVPRGKFQMTLYERGMKCVNGKGDTFVIITSAAHRIVVFPNPQDCRLKKKEGATMMVLLSFHNKNDTVVFQDKSLKQVCFALPAVEKEHSSKTTWIEVLCKSLSIPPKETIMAQNPKSGDYYTFESFKEGNTSTTTGGMPFVQCYYGVKDGVLFPMKQGLLFFKPPMFLHRSDLHSIACGRGSGGSRYVDMVLTLEDETTIEFTNIHRDELNVLNTYIHSILIPAMQKDANNQEEKEEIMDKDETDKITLGKRKRSQRKASQQARQATRAELDDADEESDSDDDDEEGWEEAHRDEESNDDESDEDDDAESNGDEMEDDVLGKQKKVQRKINQRKASHEALEAIRAELVNGEEDDSDNDVDGWEEVQHDAESDEGPDEESDEGDEKESSGRAIVDDAEEEEFFEEEDSGAATESDGEGESSLKKSRRE